MRLLKPKDQKRKISLKGLRLKAWKIQSKYFRIKAKGVCYTCGKVNDIGDTQLGHYIHGDRMDFIEDNLRVQCVHCNHFLSGNSGIFAEKLLKEIGEERFFALRPLSKTTHKWTVEELQEIIKKYETKV